MQKDDASFLAKVASWRKKPREEEVAIAVVVVGGGGAQWWWRGRNGGAWVPPSRCPLLAQQRVREKKEITIRLFIFRGLVRWWELESREWKSLAKFREKIFSPLLLNQHPLHPPSLRKTSSKKKQINIRFLHTKIASVRIGFSRRALLSLSASFVLWSMACKET